MKNIIICLLVIAAIGFIVSKFSNYISQRKEILESRKDTLQRIDNNFRANSMQYLHSNDSLNKVNKKYDTRLQLSEIVKEQLREDLNEQLNCTDSSEKCYDTLKKAVTEYLAEVDSADSLTTAKISIQDELIRIKDKQILNCDTSYHMMKTQLERSLADNRHYSDEAREYEKKIKRKNTFIAIMTCVAVLATAIVANLTKSNK